MKGELEPVRSAALQASTPWRVVLDVYLAGRDSEHTRRAYDRHITIALEAIGVATLAELNGILLSGVSPRRPRKNRLRADRRPSRKLLPRLLPPTQDLNLK